MSNIETDSRQYEILAAETVYDGFFAMRRYQLRHTRFDGEWSGVMQREIFERKPAVVVLPYDPITDRVVLIEQFRVGPAVVNLPAWQIETVAGIIDTEESPEQVARREAVEEANVTLARMLLVHPHYLPSPGGCSEALALFIGEVDSAGVGGVHGLASEHEDIRAFTVPLDAALDLVDAGRIDNGAVMVLLLWLARHKSAIRSAWLEPAADPASS
jgi:ADP-ribose pyrophosphatase